MVEDGDAWYNGSVGHVSEGIEMRLKSVHGWRGEYTTPTAAERCMNQWGLHAKDGQ